MRFVFLAILVLLFDLIFAQYNSAKEGGMGGVMSTNTSVFCAAYSPAAAGFSANSQFGVNILNHGAFNDFYTGTIAAIHHSSRGVFAYTLQSFGIKNFRETNCGLGYAKKLIDTWSVGIRANWHHIRIPNYGKKQVVSFDLGSLYQISKQLQIALTIRNPVKQPLEKQFSSSRSSSIVIGAAFQPTDKIYLACDLNKILGEGMRWHMGMNYTLHPMVEIRTGVSMKPYSIHGGIGINWQKCQFSYSSSWQTSIGFSSQISLSYDLIPSKTEQSN